MAAAPPTVASKLPDVGVSIFAVMSRLALEHEAINLSQGFPDFDCDPELITLVHESMRQGHNQYAPMPGVPALRHALAARIEGLYGARYDPEREITVTAGATEALFSTITAFVHPGDEVIVFEPAYDSYVPAIQLCGGRPVFVTLHAPDYAVDWDRVRGLITPRTRLILVNSPHNPTGTVLDADDLRTLAGLVDGTNVVVVGDEVYEHIVFDGRRHESLCRLPALAERSCVISSFGKSFHTTGWKVGYVAAPAALSAEVQRVHQFVTFAVNTPVQHAYVEFMRRRPDGTEVTRFYERKRDLFLQLVEDSAFRPLPCRGTYFQLLDYGAASDEPDTGMAMRLLEQYGVASIPTSAFLYSEQGRASAPRVLRFCFAKRDDTLEAACARLRSVAARATARG